MVLKFGNLLLLLLSHSSFNRTFVVLKCSLPFMSDCFSVCFNRTFVVLKSGTQCKLRDKLLSFNRTFVVLKCFYSILDCV